MLGKVGRWGNSKLTLTAWSGERLLKFRRSQPLNLTLSGTSAGALYRKLINIANIDEDLRVRAGEVYEGGTPRDETLDGKKLYDHVRAISARTANDWSLEGTLDVKHYLYFSANWYQKKGSLHRHPAF